MRHGRRILQGQGVAARHDDQICVRQQLYHPAPERLKLGVAIAGEHLQRVARGLPQSWTTGPILSDCRYPEVLVARAVSDGRDLQLVLRSGNGGGRSSLGIGRLDPERSYDVIGALQAEITADACGRATIELDLADRAEVRIIPRS